MISKLKTEGLTRDVHDTVASLDEKADRVQMLPSVISDILFELSNNEDTKDDESEDDLDESLFKMVSKAEKLEEQKDLVFELRGVWRTSLNKDGPADVTSLL
jgi:hypothetical protein